MSDAQTSRTDHGVDARVLANLGLAADEFRELEARLADPDTLADPAALREVSQRYRDLEPIVAAHNEYRARLDDLELARSMIETASADDRTLLHAEVDSALGELDRLAAELRELLLPQDPNSGRAVIVEIRGAEGGEEANLFAGDLFNMYLAYAANRRWKVETLAHDPSDLGGVNQVTFVVRGSDAWQRLKFEGGPHRVQRVPVTESQGRIHTSSATVAVLPEATEVDIQIDERDLRVDVYRSSGAGGQHVNTTDSAVRITHLPTGVVVTMQDERSQLQNRARAMTVLRARLYEQAQAERSAEMSDARRTQVGGGGRSEKIRTYNFKENRVTDHRIGLTVYRLTDVLAGDLDLVIEPLLREERTRQLAALES
jgi:peptide chain release factor 1